MDHINENPSRGEVLSSRLNKLDDRLNSENARPAFYTVTETARLLRVNAMTIYRAIREDAFPAIRVRSRYVIPAAAVEALAAQATETGGWVGVGAGGGGGPPAPGGGRGARPGGGGWK